LGTLLIKFTYLVSPWGSDHEISHYYKSLKLETALKSTLEVQF
jgi:hypothetical protein